jgi:hypothetical protein
MSSVPELRSGPRNLCPYPFLRSFGQSGHPHEIHRPPRHLARSGGHGPRSQELYCELPQRSRWHHDGQDLSKYGLPLSSNGSRPRYYQMETLHGGNGLQGHPGIQTAYSIVEGSSVTPKQWTTGVVTKLLEATHGQWLYRCMQIHNRNKGTQATLWKEELQKKIKAQQKLGYDGLLEEDQFLAEVNILSRSLPSREQQEYWLLTIRAAWEAQLLSGATTQHVRNNTA